MNWVRLICKEEDRSIIEALLRVNGIENSPASLFVICQEGILFEGEFEILVYIKKNKTESLIQLLNGHMNKQTDTILGNMNGNYVPLDIRRIVYFSAYANDTFAHTDDGKEYKVKYKLYELEERLLPKSFIRINKSEIVSIRYILKVTPMFKGKLMLKMEHYGESLDISRSYTQAFKERIGM